MMVHTCNPSSRKIIEASLGYIVRLHLKEREREREKKK
jgi:hypothetical protein